MLHIIKKALQPHISQPNTIPSDITIDQGFLRSFVERFSFMRVVGTKANILAKEMILAELPPTLPVRVDSPWGNIIVGNPNSAKILIGAHYDSVPGSPGADDNASAVAVMLAVIKTVKHNGNVCFVAFNSEEFGLRGSKYFVDNLGPNVLEEVHVLEMVGYSDKNPGSQKVPLDFLEGITDVGDFIGLVGNRPALVKKVIENAGIMKIPAIGIAIPKLVKVELIGKFASDLLRSDHTSFWTKGLPAIMWTDTSNFRNPNYHKATDTPDTLDYDFMAEVAKLLVRLSNP